MYKQQCFNSVFISLTPTTSATKSKSATSNKSASTCPSSNCSKGTVQQVQSVAVIANQHNDVTESLLPNYLSQSTIGGRLTGSNACTERYQPNSKMIFKGNHIYNTFKLPANQPNLDVQNVLQQNHEELQKIKLMQIWDLSPPNTWKTSL